MIVTEQYYWRDIKELEKSYKKSQSIVILVLN